MEPTIDTPQRLFLGLPLPDATRAAVQAMTAAWRLPGRAHVPADWHVTVVFLGAVAPAARDGLIAALTTADLGAPFLAEIAGIGAFPAPSRAQVLWLGARGDGLAPLHARVEAVTAACGFAPERRPYRPHVTLTRLSRPANVEATFAALAAPPLPLPVAKLVLFLSGGGRYTELAAFPLGARP